MSTAPPFTATIRHAVQPHPSGRAVAVVVARTGMSWITAMTKGPEDAEAFLGKMDRGNRYIHPFAKLVSTQAEFPFFVADFDQHGVTHEFIRSEKVIIERLRSLPRHAGNYVYAIVHRVDAPFAAKTPGADALIKLPRQIIDNAAIDAILASGKLNLNVGWEKYQ